MRSKSWRALLFGLFAIVILFNVVPVFAQGQSGQTSTVDGNAGQVISTQVVVSYLLVWLAEVIKRTKSIPWFQEGADIANRVLAAIFAAIQTVGIAYTYDTTTGQLVVTGLTLTAIMAAAVEFGRSYITQKVLWVLAFKPPAKDPTGK